MNTSLRFALAVLCLLTLTACGTRSKPVTSRDGTQPSYMETIRDLNTFPQDLTVYARNTGNDRMLLTADEQAMQDARFNRLFFGPWDMNRATIKRKDVQGMFGRARGYKDGLRSWTENDWNALKRNADLKNYPSRKNPAITLRHTNLRELPTNLPRYSKPTPDPQANPFDNFQYSSLVLGTPVFIVHESLDNQWVFVETPLAGGWLPVRDVGVVDGAFEARYRNGRYAALLRDKVEVRADRGQDTGRAHIGALFPVVSAVGDNLMVLVPVRAPGNAAATATAMFTKEEAAIKPLPLQPKLLAQVGNQMMGQPYGWGGMYENRDCSATTRDLFTPFGLWLPRNSAAQARSGRLESLRDLPSESKEKVVLDSGVPFLSLIWMRGHIGLYVGKYKGQAAFFHNVWGVRVTDEDGGDDGRHVIGRCVITSLQPGKELPNLVKGMTLRDRLLGVSTLPK